MSSRLLMSGALALSVLTAAPALAFELPQLRLPGLSPRPAEPQVQLAQASDPRIAQLEEQVRQLNGLVEELNFQILQMQDQLRRMQEDNELRFQEIEGRRSDAGGGAAPGAEQPRDHAAGSGDDEFYSDVPRVEGSGELGAPPRDFGTITFDADGNSRAATADTPPAAGGNGSDDTTVAALPSPGGADEAYRNAYEFILSGDYSTAEAGFRDFVERYPDDGQAADAHFWLGEALLAQDRPREAAEVFLSASRDYPQSRKAPDTLFKLGVSLAALNQRDVACATFAEVLQRYPQSSDALKERVRQEQSLSSC